MADSGPRTTPLRVIVTNTTSTAVRLPLLGAWLASAAPRRARGDVAVALVTDARMRVLNRTFRGLDETTDVLSFPASPSHRPVDGFLGDIVIAVGVARRQAAAAGHGFGVEARVLALHGLLHLLGFDHETDRGEMARLEARLLAAAGLREGLIARAREARR